MDWDCWEKAVALEREDRLEEACELIRSATVPRQEPWAELLAQLYAQRTRRMVAEGRLEEARQARDEAVRLMWVNASFATSGGEGLALSAQARELEQRLDALLAGA